MKTEGIELCVLLILQMGHPLLGSLTSDLLMCTTVPVAHIHTHTQQTNKQTKPFKTMLTHV